MPATEAEPTFLPYGRGGLLYDEDLHGELVARFVAGEQAAFSDLYKHSHRAVRAVLRAHRWPRDAIDDAVQEAYLQLFMTAGALRNPQRVGGWLITTADRLLRKRYHAQERAVPVGTGQIMIDTPSEEPGPEALADRDGLRKVLRDQLEPQDDNIVELLATGFSPAQLPALGIKPWQLARTRGNVRQVLHGTDWRHYGRRPGRIAGDPAVDNGSSKVEALIRNLPARQREVLTYHTFEGMKPKDIALQLNITANAARVHLHQARKTIATKLNLSMPAIEDMLTNLGQAVRRERATPHSHGSHLGERIVAVLDIAHFAKHPTATKNELRTRLKAYVDEVLPLHEGAEMTGDSMLVIMEPSAWKPGIIPSLVTRSCDYLRTDNLRHKPPLHLRAIFDIGTINTSRPGASAITIDLLQISESSVVRRATWHTRAPIVCFLSPLIYYKLRRGGHALPPQHTLQPTTISLGNRTIDTWQLTNSD